MSRPQATVLSPFGANGYEGEHGMVQDAVVIDIPLSSKFGFAWPNEPYSPVQPPPSAEHAVPLSSSEEESDSEGESLPFTGQPCTEGQAPHTIAPALPHHGHPRFSRAFSLPLPPQLNHLQNPMRGPPSASVSLVRQQSPEFSQFRELSLELADSVQTVIQTLLQISPPQVLDPVKEQFSACSLSVPTSSMSAVFTSMKNLNYISANMANFCSEQKFGDNQLHPTREQFHTAHNDFDIGEMLQSVGDALSGAAAQAGVDLVLFHGDVGMKHVSVCGDENGISYALSHVIRQVLSTAHRGDTIEVGLFTASAPPEFRESPIPVAEPSSSTDDLPITPSPIEFEGALRCTFDITHKFVMSDMESISSPPSRAQPPFRSLLLRRLLHHIRASLKSDLQPKAFPVGRACELTMTLERAIPSTINTPSMAPHHSSVQSLPDARIASEPTLENLIQFAESLRGMKVKLYASSKGSFAHHLTSYLTAWGLDVSHVSPESGAEGSSCQVEGRPNNPGLGIRGTLIDPSLGTYGGPLEGLVPPRVSVPQTNVRPSDVSFIFIDDDIGVLRERIKELCTEQPHHLHFNLRKRPSLAGNHRPRSSPQITRAMGQPQSIPSSPPSVVIVHFTSLANYKLIKDVTQSVLTLYAGSTANLPEVMIIPKPAGPRRFLTALHTAVTRPMVDPFFSPIATTPTSPGIVSGNTFFNDPTKPVNRPPSSRSSSDRSNRSNKDVTGDHSGHPPPSPLAKSDNMEYFSESTVKLGSSPSSGLVIQSPDGQPAGIFFHPRAKTSKVPSSSLLMERDKGQLFVPPDRRASLSRRTPDPEVTPTSANVSFSSLHAASASPKSLHQGTDSSVPQGDGSTPTSLAKIKVSTGIDQVGMESLPVSTLPVSRRPSPINNVTHKISSPPGSPLSDSRSLSNAPRRAPSRRPSAENKTSTPAQGGPKKVKGAPDSNIVPPISVLVVDDNPINQTILSTFMKKKKIKYDVAKNGQEAVNKWRTGGFHLILMDIQMPIMDGIQATKEIRRLEKANALAGYPPSPQLDEPRTPLQTPSDSPTDSRSGSSPYRSSVIIVALTASSLQSDRVAALAAGCNDFLTKPVSLLWLNNKIIEWGSIKALQMWADLRPEAVKSITSGQAAQARSVAERLHVPQGRTTPPSRPPATSTVVLKNAVPPISGMPTPAPWSPIQAPAIQWPSSPTSNHLGFIVTALPNGNGSKPLTEQTISEAPPNMRVGPEAAAPPELATDTAPDVRPPGENGQSAQHLQTPQKLPEQSSPVIDCETPTR